MATRLGGIPNGYHIDNGVNDWMEPRVLGRLPWACAGIIAGRAEGRRPGVVPGPAELAHARCSGALPRRADTTPSTSISNTRRRPWRRRRCLCTSAMGAGISGLVRVPSQDPSVIARVLDNGAVGIIVPHVNSAAEAEAVVNAVAVPADRAPIDLRPQCREWLRRAARSGVDGRPRRAHGRSGDDRNARGGRGERRHRGGRRHRHDSARSERSDRRNGYPRAV